jgi:taurine transport system substrate-binding protein
MTKMLTTRRRLLQGVGLSAAVLAAPAIVRAAPASANFAFFVSTSPFMIAKGDGSIEQAAGAKVNWIEVASGAEINTGMAAGSMDIGFGIGSSPTASGISQGIGYEVIAMMDNIGPAEEMTVRKSANIKSPADFKGKNVGVPFGSTSHFRLLGPVKSKMLAAGGEVYKTYDKLEAAGYVIADLIIARTAWAAANPAAVAAILAAYGKALDAYTKSPDDASIIVGRQAGVTAAVAKADMAEYDFVPLKTQLTPDWLGAPGTEGKFAGVLKGTADFLVEQKSIRAAPALSAFVKAINTSFLAKNVG